MDRIRASWHSIDAEFTSLGFEQVELDPAGYRRGALLSIAPLPTPPARA
jgi:PP-loop superfamily ATP-utilizing enzyme